MIRSTIALVLCGCGVVGAPMTAPPSDAGSGTPEVSAPTDAADGCIPEDGGDEGLIATGQGPVRAIAVDAERVYWTVSNGTSSSVRARDKTRCAPVVTLASFPDIGDIPDIVVDADRLYLHLHRSWFWCALGSCTSIRPIGASEAFAIDSTRLFFTEAAEGFSLWMVSCIKGPCTAKVLYEVTHPDAITSNDVDVFWSRGGAIYTSDVGGVYAPTTFVAQSASLLRADTHYVAWVSGQDIFSCWIPCTTPLKMGTGSTRQLTIAHGNVLWIDGRVAGELKACAESGCKEAPSTIVKDAVTASAVDARSIVWSANGMIRRSPF